MDQLRTILCVFLFSASALAQIEFNNIIETNMTRQNGLADDMATANRLAESIEAESDDFEKPMTENYKSVKTGSEATVTDGTSTPANRKPTSDKDFSFKLKPATGADSALKYFPNLKKQKKSSRQIARASFDKNEDYLKSARTKKSKKVKNANKSKTSPKVVKSDKKKKSKALTTASNK